MYMWILNYTINSWNIITDIFGQHFFRNASNISKASAGTLFRNYNIIHILVFE